MEKLSAPQNLTAVGTDCAVQLKWSEVKGAAGYRLYFYRSDNPLEVYKSRYAQKCGKTVLGFTNGKTYYAAVCAYAKENGRELSGEMSERVIFVPVSKTLKAQKTICLEPGQYEQLVWEENNAVPSATFVSDNTDVATVNSRGLVTAVSKGTAEITVTSLTKSKFVTTVEVGRSLSAKEGKAVLMLAGDIMCTSVQQKLAAGQSYDFHDCFRRVRNIFRGADFSAAVLEPTCCDSVPFEQEQKRFPDGTPNGNSPSTLISAIAAAGIEGIVTATNRSCSDEVFKASAEQINQCGIRNIGTMGDNPVLLNIRGIKVAVIASTMVTNGSQNSQGDPKNGIYTKESLGELISFARKRGADYIVVYQHWGVSNSSQVRKSQTEQARFLADSGADLIIGAHPHKVQKFSVLKASDGRRVHVVYSAGNLLTSMDEMDGNRDGIIVRAELLKNEKGVTARISYIPCLTEMRGWGAEVMPLYAPYSRETRAAFERIKAAVGNGILNTSFRPRVFMSGSVQLDKIFRFGGGFKCSRAGLRLSQISLGGAAGIPHDQIETDAGDKLRLDLSRDLASAIRKANPDYVVVDFYAAAFTGCYKYEREQDGELCFFSNTAGFRQSKFFRENKEYLTRINPPFGEYIWKPMIKRYAQRLLEVMPADRIILFRNYFGEHSTKDNKLRSAQPPKNKNRFMKALEDYFISLVKPLIVDLAGHYFTVDEKPEYEDAYYADAYRAALELTNGSGRRHVFLPDESIWFSRVIKYYDNMRARSYFSWLLNMNSAADIIIAYTSKEFAAAYRDRLMKLRHTGETSLTYVRTFFDGDSGADEIVRAADIINTVLNGSLDRSYDFFEPAFRGNYGIVRRMVRLLAAETNAAVNEQSAELVFLLRGKPQLKRYISSLNKMTLDIWGSSVSRESVNCAQEAHIGTYIFRQPQLLAFEDPIKAALPDDPELFCGSRWRRRNLEDSFMRSGDADIFGSDAKWIVLDFCDVISPMIEYKGGIFQTDDFIRKTEYFKSIQPECHECWLFEKRTMKYCYDTMTKFAEMIKDKYGENIILIKTEPKNKYIDLNHRLQSMETDGMFNIKKKFISLCEERFANVTGCSVIDISKRFYASDSFPLGGANIVHYEQEFYRQAGVYINEIITGGSRRIFNRVDENYLLLRDMRINR